MQSLRGIRDIHESGVDEHSFSEVTAWTTSSLPFRASGCCETIFVLHWTSYIGLEVC